MKVTVHKCPSCLRELNFSEAYLSKGLIMIDCTTCNKPIEIDKAICMHKGCSNTATFLYKSESISFYSINWSTYCEEHQKKFSLFSDVKVDQSLNKISGICPICNLPINGIEVIGPNAPMEAISKIGEAFPSITDVRFLVKNMHFKCKNCNTVFHRKCSKKLKGHSFWSGISKAECINCKNILNKKSNSIIFGIFDA